MRIEEVPSQGREDRREEGRARCESERRALAPDTSHALRAHVLHRGQVPSLPRSNIRSRPCKPKEGQFMNFSQGIPEQKFDVNRACFPKEKQQNSQKWAKFMNFSFWPFLWFGLPGRLLKIGNGRNRIILFREHCFRREDSLSIGERFCAPCVRKKKKPPNGPSKNLLGS